MSESTVNEVARLSWDSLKEEEKIILPQRIWYRYHNLSMLIMCLTIHASNRDNICISIVQSTVFIKVKNKAEHNDCV